MERKKMTWEERQREAERAREVVAAQARARREDPEFAAWLRDSKERWRDALKQLAE